MRARVYFCELFKVILHRRSYELIKSMCIFLPKTHFFRLFFWMKKVNIQVLMPPSGHPLISKIYLFDIFVGKHEAKM